MQDIFEYAYLDTDSSSELKKSKWLGLVEDIKTVVTQAFGYYLDEIEMIETPKYIFKSIDEFENFMDRHGNKVFGEPIIITFKDEAHMTLTYLDKIKMYALDYRPSMLLESDYGHDIYASTYNQVH